MIATFLKFLLTERHDDTIILDSLISRINSMSRVSTILHLSYNPTILLILIMWVSLIHIYILLTDLKYCVSHIFLQLCMVSLSLFLTLVNLNCEDVMFQLVFR